MKGFLGFVLIVLVVALVFGGEEALKALLTFAGLAVAGLVALIVIIILTVRLAQQGQVANGNSPNHESNRQLSESEMVSLLREHPDRLLGERLTFVDRECTIGPCRFDLVFLDHHRQRLVVEVKRGPASDKDVGQIIRYIGALAKNDPGGTNRVMLVAPLISTVHKEGLKRAGVECRELTDEDYLRARK